MSADESIPGPAPRADVLSSMDESLHSTKQTLLGCRLYVAFARPRGVVDDEYARSFARVLPDHWRWLGELEEQGRLFAAGPFVSPDGDGYPGDGMLIFRTSTLADAVELADSDPISRAGLRSSEVRPWEMNEGGFTVTVRYSNSRFELR